MSKILLTSMASAVVAMLHNSAIPTEEKQMHLTNITDGLADLANEFVTGVATDIKDVTSQVVTTVSPVVHQAADTIVEKVETAVTEALVQAEHVVMPDALEPVVDPVIRAIMDKVGGSVEDAITWVNSQLANMGGSHTETAHDPLKNQTVTDHFAEVAENPSVPMPVSAPQS